jgi:tellurite resistance protein
MLFGIGSRQKRDAPVAQVALSEIIAQSDAEQAADQRRLMYERIARGHAMAEAEEDARRKWRGK